MLNLYCRTLGKDFGDIGAETSLVDVDGINLRVGDIVLLTENECNIGRLRFVAHDSDNDVDYIMGSYMECVGLVPSKHFSWKKIAGYENFAEGFRLNDIEFVDFSAVNKRQV